MSLYHSIILAAVGLIVASCATPKEVTHGPQEVSVHELLSSPQRFDGARVFVKGFFLMPMVGDIALYDTEKDYRRRQNQRSIRVEADRGKNDLMPFQVKMCFVEGTFHAINDAGVRGSLREVTRLELAK